MVGENVYRHCMGCGLGAVDIHVLGSDRTNIAVPRTEPGCEIDSDSGHAAQMPAGYRRRIPSLAPRSPGGDQVVGMIHVIAADHTATGNCLDLDLTVVESSPGGSWIGCCSSNSVLTS